MQHVDKRRQAKHIRQEDEFVASLVRDASGGFKKLDSLLPLRMGQVDVLCEGVKMGGEASHDLAHARICIRTEIAQKHIGDIVRGDIAHHYPP